MTAPLAVLLFALAAAVAPQDPVPPPAPSTAVEWNERGVELLGEEHLDEALDAFQRARALAPEDAVVAVNLARAFGHRGRRRAEAGKLAEALADFRAGTATDRDGGSNEVLAAQVLARQGAREAARELVDRVRADFPDNLAAARLAADLRAVAGDLDGAVEVLSAALARGPADASLAGRLRQLEEEREAFRGFLTDSSAHFDFRYDPRREEVVQAVPAIMSDLEDAYLRVAADFGLAPVDRVLVLVLDRARYRLEAPAWSAGLYDGRIRLAVGDFAAERETLRGTMRHEFVHAALHRLGPPLPTWFQEGLAQLVEDRSVPAARRLLATEDPPGIAELGDDWTAWTDRGRVTRAYAYALSLCRFLGEEYGPTCYALLFEALRTAPFEEAFRRTFGKDLEAVDAEHRAALRRAG